MVWMANTDGGGEAGNLSIVARRFHLDGSPALIWDDATQWIANQNLVGDQYAPRCAIDDDGRFMVVWEDDDRTLYGRVFEADVTGLDQIQINPDLQNALENYYAPDVTVNRDANGHLDFVIAYGYNPDEDDVVLTEYGNSVHAVIGSAFQRLAGDANNDGQVDDTDLTILAGNWQTAVGGGWDDGDFDESGFVDDTDLTILAGNWQEGVPLAGLGAVPEPATLALLAVGLCGRAGQRRPHRGLALRHLHRHGRRWAHLVHLGAGRAGQLRKADVSWQWDADQVVQAAAAGDDTILAGPHRLAAGGDLVVLADQAAGLVAPFEELGAHRIEDRLLAHPDVALQDAADQIQRPLAVILDDVAHHAARRGRADVHQHIGESSGRTGVRPP